MEQMPSLHWLDPPNPDACILIRSTLPLQLRSISLEARHSDYLDEAFADSEVCDEGKVEDRDLVFMENVFGMEVRVIHRLADRAARLAFLRQQQAQERGNLATIALVTDSSSIDSKFIGDDSVRSLAQSH